VGELSGASGRPVTVHLAPLTDYRARMAPLFRRHRPGTRRRADSDDTAHLVAFAESRTGVEAYVEPRTAITETTVVLIAASGEWTRRRVDGPDGAAALGKRLNIPVYDVGVVGYPRRMREWNERQKADET
jgi:hypothetical protein